MFYSDLEHFICKRGKHALDCWVLLCVHWSKTNDQNLMVKHISNLAKTHWFCLYFEGDQYIETDAAASITEGTYDATHRIIPLSTNNDGNLEGTWDIIVDGDGTRIRVLKSKSIFLKTKNLCIVIIIVTLIIWWYFLFLQWL